MSRQSCSGRWSDTQEKSHGLSATTAPSSSHGTSRSSFRLTGVTRVRTSPYYPQSNGKLERWHGSLKRECVRPAAVTSFDEARRRISSYVDHYNNVRLHSALGYVTPADKLI